MFWGSVGGFLKENVFEILMGIAEPAPWIDGREKDAGAWRVETDTQQRLKWRSTGGEEETQIGQFGPAFPSLLRRQK